MTRKFMLMDTKCINYMSLKFDIKSLEKCKIKFKLIPENTRFDVNIIPCLKLNSNLFYGISKTLYNANEPEFKDYYKTEYDKLKELLSYHESSSSINIPIKAKYDCYDPSFTDLSKNGQIVYNHYFNNSYTINLYKNLYNIKNKILEYIFKSNDKEKIYDTKKIIDAIDKCQSSNDYSDLLECVSFKITTNMAALTKYLRRKIIDLSSNQLQYIKYTDINTIYDLPKAKVSPFFFLWIFL